MVTHFGIPRIFLGIFPHILFKRHVGYWTMSVWPMFTESHSKMIEYVLHKFPRIQLGTGELMTGELATGGIMDFVHIQGKTKGGKQEWWLNVIFHVDTLSVTIVWLFGMKHSFICIVLLYVERKREEFYKSEKCPFMYRSMDENMYGRGVLEWRSICIFRVRVMWLNWIQRNVGEWRSNDTYVVLTQDEKIGSQSCVDLSHYSRKQCCSVFDSPVVCPVRPYRSPGIFLCVSRQAHRTRRDR